MHSVENLVTATTRADVWAVGNAQCQAHYTIVGEAEPDLLCRVLNHFALQFLTPTRVSAVQEDGLLYIDTQVDGLTWHRAHVIGEKLRNLISVCSVELQKLESTYPQALKRCHP